MFTSSVENWYNAFKVFIKNALLKTGTWNFYERTRSSWKPITTALINNRPLYKFLVEHDYKIKSGASACKILSKIPDELKHYFYRGVSDGDGRFYHYKNSKKNKKNVLNQFSIASCFIQDWTYMKNLFDSLELNFSIKKDSGINKKTNKLNSSSQIRISNKQSIINFGNYLYHGYENYQLGFPRKYQKFQDIVNNVDYIN